MNRAMRWGGATWACVLLLGGAWAWGQDWPQWRGANRDAKATSFQAPASWPQELTKKWSVAVGDGDATPALVGDKLYVFTLQEGNEVIRCLEAATGKELWQDKYPAQGASGPASGHAGPRSSPTVADGKVVTLGVRGTLSCLDADSGKVLWRKTDFSPSVPQFFTSSSPLVVEGLCIAQFGGQRGGGIAAIDLTTGEEKWKWTGDGAAYGSPVPMTIDGAEVVVAPTDRNMVALDASNGKVLWQILYTQGRYNAATPIVAGETLIYAGPTSGATAEKLAKKGEELAAEPLWRNSDNSLIYNTPVLKGNLLFGLSTQNNLFCINTETGATAWSAPLSGGSGGQAQQAPPGGQRKRPGGGGGGGTAGYGSLVDGGNVLFALTPSSQLVAFEPSDKEFKQLASYKVADSPIYAYPIVSGNRVFVKDRNSVTLWTFE